MPSLTQTRSTVSELNTSAIETSTMSDSGHQNKPKGPKGITFSGETFIVPETHDMVKTLFDPTIKKSNFELIILGLLFSNLLVFLIPNNNLRISIFIGFYIFWRLSYNFGIGWLLQHQSNDHLLVQWAIKYKLFDKNNKNFWLNLFKVKLKVKEVMLMISILTLLNSTLG